MPAHAHAVARRSLAAGPRPHPLHFLPDLPEQEILDALNAAAGNEVESGKLASSENSSALAVNAFGRFPNRPKALPPLPGLHAA